MARRDFSARPTRLSRAAVIVPCAGVVLCGLAFLCALLDYTASPWQWAGPANNSWIAGAALLGLLGLGVIGAGIVLGIVAFMRSRKRAEHVTVWVTVRPALAAVVALACIGAATWMADRTAYQRYVHPLPLAERTRLDRLNAETVVRTYFETRDPSLQYWPDDSSNRADWHDSSSVMDFYTLAGLKGFVLVPWKVDAVQPWDADHREYRVGYTTRVGDYMDPAGRHDEIVDVSRDPGGPWRVGYIGDGM